MINAHQTYPSAVRLPSHIDPPFRAHQWVAEPNGLVITSPAQRQWVLPVDWNGGQFGTPAIPNGTLQTGPQLGAGLRAELTYARFFGLFDGASVFPVGTLIWQVYRNGVLQPGFQWRNVEFENFSDNLVGGIQNVIRNLIPPVQAPIHFEEGDRCDIRLRAAGAGEGLIGVILGGAAGWVYPATVEGDAGSIRATGADPGARDPLGIR